MLSFLITQCGAVPAEFPTLAGLTDLLREELQQPVMVLQSSLPKAVPEPTAPAHHSVLSILCHCSDAESPPSVHPSLTFLSKVLQDESALGNPVSRLNEMVPEASDTAPSNDITPEPELSAENTSVGVNAATAAEVQIPAVPPSPPPAETDRTVMPMLQFLVHHSGEVSSAFPTLGFLCDQMREESSNILMSQPVPAMIGDVTVPKAVPATCIAPTTASPSSLAPLPLEVPLPVVPGAGHWVGTAAAASVPVEEPVLDAQRRRLDSFVARTTMSSIPHNCSGPSAPSSKLPCMPTEHTAPLPAPSTDVGAAAMHTEVEKSPVVALVQTAGKAGSTCIPPSRSVAHRRLIAGGMPYPVSAAARVSQQVTQPLTAGTSLMTRRFSQPTTTPSEIRQTPLKHETSFAERYMYRLFGRSHSRLPGQSISTLSCSPQPASLHGVGGGGGHPPTDHTIEEPTVPVATTRDFTPQLSMGQLLPPQGPRMACRDRPDSSCLANSPPRSGRSSSSRRSPGMAASSVPGHSTGVRGVAAVYEARGIDALIVVGTRFTPLHRRPLRGR